MSVAIPGLSPFVRCLWVAALLAASASRAWSGSLDAKRQALPMPPVGDLQAQPILPDPARPGTLCDAAVRTAEVRHRLPPGLLFAISKVESGRLDPAVNRVEPWPWTVQAEGKGIYFDSKAKAVRWVQDAMARGVTSIDTGCLQVNLFYHPHAFATLEDAFDPERNADYAARFLLQLYAAAGDWRQAEGFYHSQTLALATSYRERVERVMSGGTPNWAATRKPPTTLDRLGTAWRATFADNDPAPANPTPADLHMHDWSALLHTPAKRQAQPSHPLRPQSPRRYAGPSYLLSSVGRPQ
jgi:hypothetical protein